MRVTKSVTKSRRHRKVVKAAKGYRWGRSKIFSLAKNAVVKAGQHAYASRRQKKRDFRQLWILRISAALREDGKNYSTFVKKLSDKKIVLNRKVLSNLAAVDREVFRKIVDEVFA
jgi:large subunit ribosomal protein L20